MIYFPPQRDAANDDPAVEGVESDEDESPNALGDMYVEDSPGFGTSFYPAGDTLAIWKTNFLEWTRVTFNGVPPEGPGLLGSRMSPQVHWHVSHRVVPASTGGIWRRSTGADPPGPNDPEVPNVNDIGGGHIELWVPPYN